MAVLEFDGKLLIIDCGVLFPEAEQPGVDLILPDFGVIEHRLDDIAAVVLTHGHEDHIGEIGRASCGERGSIWVVAVSLNTIISAHAPTTAPYLPYPHSL